MHFKTALTEKNPYREKLASKRLLKNNIRKRWVSGVRFRVTTSDGPMALQPLAVWRRFISEKTVRRVREANAPKAIGKVTAPCPPVAARQAAPPHPPRRPAPLLLTLPLLFTALSPRRRTVLDLLEAVLSQRCASDTALHAECMLLSEGGVLLISFHCRPGFQREKMRKNWKKICSLLGRAMKSSTSCRQCEFVSLYSKVAFFLCISRLPNDYGVGFKSTNWSLTQMRTERNTAYLFQMFNFLFFILERAFWNKTWYWHYPDDGNSTFPEDVEVKIEGDFPTKKW